LRALRIVSTMARSVIATLPPRTLARHRDELIDRARAATTPSELFTEVSTRLRRLVPFDAAQLMGTDPATGLPTLPTVLENLGHGDAERCLSYWNRELLVEDVNLFRDVARFETPAATLRARTDDWPVRSARYRELLRPMGFDDELRAVLRTDHGPWGAITLLREKGRAPFAPDETALVASLSAPLAEALRAHARALDVPLATARNAPGVMTFDAAGALTSMSEEARAWLDELPPSTFPRGPIEEVPSAWVLATLVRARAIAEGREHGSARVRLRTRAGRWVVGHASCLRDRDGAASAGALVIEPAQAADVAPLIFEAYELSRREQEVARLLARGASTADIGHTLFISRHTVRDHVKAILAKVGVSSRAELVAKLFAEHYAPLHLADDAVLVVNKAAA
jgi:DNA-binding CsgD family transcriptional regulator